MYTFLDYLYLIVEECISVGHAINVLAHN